MKTESIKAWLDACYQAKRIRELLPALPDGVSPSFIQYLDVIEHLQRRNVCVKISDISDALNIPRPGVTRTVKDMVNGALVLQAAYGAVDLPVVGRFGSTAGLSAVSTGSQVLNLPFAYCMSIQPNASLTKISLAAPVSTTVGIALNVAFYLHLNQAERKNGMKSHKSRKSGGHAPPLCFLVSPSGGIAPAAWRTLRAEFAYLPTMRSQRSPKSSASSSRPVTLATRSPRPLIWP